MSLVSAIRDYTELLNNIADSSSFNIIELVKVTLLYVINSFAYIIFYIISFQWVKDITHLPILLPSLNAKILNEYYVLDKHINLIELGPISSLEQNKLLLGFLNAFFLALPFSVPQIIAIRRWLIQGSVAGLSSVIGFRLGQTLFFASILLGLRFLIIPWLSYEPLSYIIGLVLLINLIYDMTHENLVTIPQSQTSRHLKIFALHFGLAWTEQTVLFQYFSNNTFSNNFSNLDIFINLEQNTFWFSHLTYIIGLLVGGLIFDLLFLLGIANLIESTQIWFKIPLSTWKKQSNIWFLRISLALSFTSIPYYTLDYLLLGPLGFVSQEKSLVQGSELLFNKNKLAALRIGVEKEMFLDPFNRAIVSQTGLDGYEPSIFETKNFEGERAWAIGDISKKANITSAAENTKAIAKRLFNSSLLQSNTKLERKPEILKAKPSELTSLGGQDAQQEFINKQIELSENRPNFNARFNDRVQDYYVYSQNSDDSKLVILNTVTANYFPTFLNESVKFQSRQESLIKNKFYSNPIYKNLLSVYIDSILQQQPSDYTLTKSQEKQLYEARLALEDYYNSLRNYTNLSYSYQFNDAFDGTKGFSNKVYNQQFKGNLKIVRRLFGVTWDNEENKASLRKISFDQTLYENTPNNFYHEELTNSKTKAAKVGFALNPMPLYAGWDNELRKFTISNRYLERDIAGLQSSSTNSSFTESSDANIFTKLNSKNQYKKELENTDTKFIVKDFTTWPLVSTETNQKQNFLFEPANKLKANKELLESLNLSQQNDLVNEKLPLSINFAKNQKPIYPPSRGGFVWPGENFLEFQNILK